MATVIETGERIVCHCLRVREGEIRDAIDAGVVTSLRCVMKETGAGTGCTACHCTIKKLLAQSASPSPTCVMR